MSATASPSRAWLGNTLVLLALLAAAIALGLWQSGAWWVAMPRSARWWSAGLVMLGYAGFCGTLWARQRRRDRAVPQADEIDSGTVLLAWASQTGFAQQLAEHTAQALRGAGVAVRMLPMHQVTLDVLREHRRALWIASTTGEGDPPDHVLGFTRGVLGQSMTLDGLEYAVLALGDRSYARFCAFGRQLDQWLHHNGARPLFDRIDVDAGDGGALRHWQHHLGQIAGHVALPDWSAPKYKPWRLASRRWLNEGSQGGPAYLVVLTPDDAADLDWQAGDIAEIGPRHAKADVDAWLAATGLDGHATVTRDEQPQSLSTLLAHSHLPEHGSVAGLSAQTVANALQPLPHREYSIASLPADGSLQLLVRQMRRPDGRLGSGSGWLTAVADIGAGIDLRIRRNPSFHPPADDRPMILVGNGTGLAGLRALMKARIAAGHRHNWLVFGERNAEHDFHFRDEIAQWQDEGWLQYLDVVFSRETASLASGTTYVQHVLREHSERLHDWLTQGAVVYVCGSLQGMAPAVDAVLREAVGLDVLETMAAEGRYRRDVY